MKSNCMNGSVTVFVRVWGPWKSWWTRVKPPLGWTVSGTSESWIAWIAVTWRQIHISRSAMRSSDRMDWATPRRAWEYPRSQVKLVPWLQSEWINSANKQLVDGFAQPSQGMSVRVNGSLIFVCNGKWVDVLWTQIENLGSKVAYQLVIIKDFKEIFSSIIPKTEFSWIVHSLMRISVFFRYLSHNVGGSNRTLSKLGGYRSEVWQSTVLTQGMIFNWPWNPMYSRFSRECMEFWAIHTGTCTFWIFLLRH